MSDDQQQQYEKGHDEERSTSKDTIPRKQNEGSVGPSAGPPTGPLDPIITKSTSHREADFFAENEIRNLPRRQSAGHTFIVSTVVTEEQTVTETKQTTPQLKPKEITQNKTSEERKQSISDTLPTCSINCSIPQYIENKAIVPLYSSLPSKLLRLHAKRSAQALLHEIESMESPFGSEGCTSAEGSNNDCADIYDIPSPTEPPMSPPPPRSTPVDCCVDGGVGSSIDDSEESEVDDELKPLAVDNHVVLHDVDVAGTSQSTGTSSAAGTDEAIGVLSEENLEKFRKHHHPHALDNIYLHPNFKYEQPQNKEEASPPPAVAPANSPSEQPMQRVHRSFLTMPKKHVHIADEVEQANSVTSLPTSVATTEPNGDQPLVNEIDTIDPALIPSDDLSIEITDAVEYYFSNECILKDAFLLKHVRRNKEGFVSLKLVSSFKRVRQLTKEWKVVGYALRLKSRKIELNDLGTKVRRLEPLPSFDETMPSRTIVACDLPLEKLTIEKVSDIFSKCGEIALIRILKPGMAIPVDVRQFMNKYPEMQQKECALVEYLESSAARDAKHLPGSFQVFDMVAPKKKTGKKAVVIPVAAPVTRMVENYRYYNDATYERTRGGSFSGVVPHEGDLRFKLRRNNSDFPTRMLPEYQRHGSFSSNSQQPHNYQSQPYQQPHRSSFNGSGEHIHHQHHHPQQQQQQQQYHYQPRSSMGHESHSSGVGVSGAVDAASPSSNMNFYAFPPRRYSNASTVAAGLNDSQSQLEPINGNNSNICHHQNNNNHTTSTLSRRLSNCSDSYSSYSEMSRRPSNCGSEGGGIAPSAPPMQRRDSNCSENCPCARRVSDFGQTEVYRKTSQGSIGSGERRFSNGSLQFERSFSNASEHSRRMSSNGNDFNTDRKQSLETQTGLTYNENDGNVGGGGGGYNVFRRFSNNFNNNHNIVGNKLAQYDNAQYINGRRISTDSGYDRRCSYSSEYEGSPRSRTGSFLNAYKHGGDFDGSPRSRTSSFLESRSRSGSFALRNTENLVRTPMGPDGSKGFGTRARKFGQTVSPVN